MNALLNRRAFLLGTGALVVSFSMRGQAQARGTGVAALEKARKTGNKQVDSYFVINADGSVTLYSGKVDLGTGHRIALPQIVADELGIQLERVKIVEGDTALTPDQGSTSGSNGMMRGGVQTRRAASTARAHLIRLGAEKLGAPAETLDTADGEVRPRAGGKGVSFAELIAGKSFDLELDAKAPVRKPSEWKYTGKSIRRPDLPAKVTGRFVWMHDFAVEGMLHGRVLHPPRPGAKLVNVDESSIAGISGARVVRVKNFLGVVADREWHAEKAARQLKVEWSGGGIPTSSNDAESYLRKDGPRDRDRTVDKKGDFAATFADLPKKVSADFYWPMQSHASLGPSCAVADYRDGGLTVWTASQGTHKYHHALAQIFGLPGDKVRLVYLDGAGCYGRNGHEDAAADAALLSRATGKPVRVQWSRADELALDPKGPPQTLTIDAALDGHGRIAAWRSQMWIPRPTSKLPFVPLLAAQTAGLPQKEGISPGSLHVGATPVYDIPHMETVLHYMTETPLRASPLRAPGKAGNLMAVESVMDELALLAEQDPVAFRLAHLANPRTIEVLKRAAALHGWDARAKPRRDGKGRGIAMTHYKGTETWVGLAVDVEVDRATGAIKVVRASCAHDCGQIINPDNVRAQVEGSIIQTISRSLHEETTYGRDGVTSTDWASYRLLTFPEVPAIAIDLIDHPDQRPLGAGEAAVAPVAAAISNAVFDATGVRLRRAPFTPQRMRAAMLETKTKAG
ncbi:MAG: molybdopterin cofactor-binding domain-containing protein [Beijerinckiaceae bacterium]